MALGAFLGAIAVLYPVGLAEFRFSAISAENHAKALAAGAVTLTVLTVLYIPGSKLTSLVSHTLQKSILGRETPTEIAPSWLKSFILYIVIALPVLVTMAITLVLVASQGRAI